MNELERAARQQKSETEIQPILQSTVGIVLSLQHSFRTYFETFASVDSAQLTDDLPEEIRDACCQVASTDLTVHSFSDTVFAYTPAFTRDGIRNLKSVYGLIAVGAMIMLEALSAGVALRGSIDVSLGIPLGNGELYGPVLARTHQLESEAAQWPRILVGDGLDYYLDRSFEDNSSEVHAIAYKALTRVIGNSIANWIDGRPMIDFGHPDYVSRFEQSAPGQWDHARSFAREQLLRFATERNDKLSQRYAELCCYLDACARRLRQV